MSSDLIIPQRVQLETAFGCNASCIMCPVDLPTQRKKGIMSFDLFKKFCDDMLPYKDRIEKVDLWGLGEPLLDKGLFKKIRYGKDLGFQSLAIATNADLFTDGAIDQLLDSGLDTVIFSIDGVTSGTHEAIRPGVTFDKVRRNAEALIARRNAGGYRTKFVFRFIKQELNEEQWPDFSDYWQSRLSPAKGDIIIGYNRHSWGGEIAVADDARNDLVPDSEPCHHVYDRLMVLWDGTVPLCCADLHHASWSLGNIKDSSPIEIFNNEKIRAIRTLHEAGRRNEMDICAKCTILHSEAAQQVIQQSAVA